jgi:ribosomal protein S18 acetylase RimI-like enzyme
VFVRQAHLDDLAAVKSFDEWDSCSEARIQAGECYVAGFEEPPIGFALFDRSFFHRPFVSILFVHPEHRHRGLGSAMLGHLESIVTDDKLWISTNVENLAMQRMLHKRGYELSGVVNNLAALPELVFVKRLGGGRA